MQHEYQPPTVRFASIASTAEGMDTIHYRDLERGCCPVGGVALYLGPLDSAQGGQVVRVHLGDEPEGSFTHPRPLDGSAFYTLIAFDDSPTRCTSLPANEPLTTGPNSPPAGAESIRSFVQAFLVDFLTPERIAAAEAQQAIDLGAV